jgi:hypothetical protein
MQIRKVLLPSFLLAASLYILLPTADEILIHPIFGWFLSAVFHVPLLWGMLLSMVIYRIIGSLLLIGALVTGGKPVYNKLRQDLTKKQLMHFKSAIASSFRFLRKTEKSK